ncbi:MAG: cytidylate kinase family protein [Clostridia bacterium]|nr:cytidylate kinase family protein [Clostridia bacterium]
MQFKISLAGDLGSGKSTVAKILKERFNAQIVSAGHIYREIAAKLNMTVEEFNINNESDKQYDTLVDDMLKSYDEKCGDYIFDSRLAWHFVPSAVSFYLSADKEVAAKRVFDAMRVDEHFASFEETLASLTSRRASERRRYYDYYKVDIMDMANYDCVIDTTNLCPEDVAERIIAFYMQKIGQ